MANISLSDSDDKVFGTIFNDVISGAGGHDTIYGGWGYDQLFGGKGNDILDGSLGNDLLMGQEGDDFLITSDSAEMHGGTGNDTYRIIAGDVFKPKLIEKAGEGVDTVQLSIWRGKSFTLGEHFENLSIQDYRWVDAPGPDYYVATTLTGNGANNVITGGGFGDAVYGLGGNDTLRGGGGNDELVGGAGNDRLEGGVGADSMEGGTGDDTYLVDNKSDMVTEYWGQGVDTVQTGLASYTLGFNVENLAYTGSASTAFVGFGNALANKMTLGGGADFAYGADGNDDIYASGGKDYVSGGSGDDKLRGEVGDDTLSGGVGADWLDGGDGKDVLYGDGGDDIMHGGAGDDMILGGTGYDRASGGAGADSFIYHSVAEFRKDGLVSGVAGEAIWDFTEEDTIHMVWMDADATQSGNEAFIFLGEAKPVKGQAGVLWTAKDGAVTHVYGDVNGDAQADFQLDVFTSLTLDRYDFQL